MNGNGHQRVISNDPEFDRLVTGTGLFDYIALGGNIPGRDTGRAREASAEAAKRSGRKFLGVAVPDELFYRRESRAMTTVQGGDWIGTEYRPDLFVNMLYENMFSPGLGVTIIDNLVENIDIPRQTGSGGASFFAEDSPISLTSLSADKLQGVPKFLGSRHEYSLPMVVQAEPAVQELARRDMVASHSRTIDLAMLTAGGSPAPVGLLGLSIDSSVSMATPSWTTVLELIEKVESNSSTGTGFLGNPPITTMLRSTPRLAAPATTDIMVMESPRELAGYPYVSSMLVPSHHLFFGRWSDLLLLRWKAFDLLVNPYAESSYKRGNVQVRMISCVDIQCRHIESFACATDVALS
jgi:hypothetical protein